jgi:hypothetical protein
MTLVKICCNPSVKNIDNKMPKHKELLQFLKYAIGKG